jgi:outer membrane lipoprotein SlyB
MNARVTKIERVRRSATGATGGSATGSAVGSSAAGATGAAASDRVYRITVRMNDGSTQVITQDSAPTFKRGDRVRVENDMIVQ